MRWRDALKTRLASSWASSPNIPPEISDATVHRLLVFVEDGAIVIPQRRASSAEPVAAIAGGGRRSVRSSLDSTHTG